MKNIGKNLFKVFLVAVLIFSASETLFGKIAKEPEKEEGLSEEVVGFGLFPSTRKLMWRTEVKNHFEYDNNVYLVERPITQDTVYRLDLSSQLVKRWKRLMVSLEGGLEVLDYFNENVMDETLPRGTFKLQYQDKSFYVALKNEFAQRSIINTLELNKPSRWLQNTFVGLFGFRYQKFIFEISNRVDVTNYQDIPGDHVFYGQGFLVGYRVCKEAHITLEYKWDFIDYREPYARKIDPINPLNVPDPTRQENTLINSILIGSRLRVAKKVYGNFQGGVQFTDKQKAFFRFNVGLDWHVLSRLTVFLKGKQEVVPTFFGDYQLYGVIKGGLKFKATPRLHLSGYGGIEWSRPEREEKAHGYRGGTGLHYRIYKGISLEGYYEVWSVFSKQPAGGNLQHRLGGGINIVF